MLRTLSIAAVAAAAAEKDCPQGWCGDSTFGPFDRSCCIDDDQCVGGKAPCRDPQQEERRSEDALESKHFPGKDTIIKVACELASSEMIEEKVTGEICKLIEKKFPSLPDQECTGLVDKLWDKIVTKCPPKAEAVTATVAAADGPCCNKACEAPMVKMFSVDAAHGFCGESCMDPKKFSIYKKFEANLTIAKDQDIHPCSKLLTPSNTRRYTDYFQTVTHGFPGVLTVTLDLYAPSEMPDHSCCSVPLIKSLNCVGIPGKPKSMTIFGTGPYCCPSEATEETPCSSNVVV
jgi:hypothetical protein